MESALVFAKCFYAGLKVDCAKQAEVLLHGLFVVCFESGTHFQCVFLLLF